MELTRRMNDLPTDSVGGFPVVNAYPFGRTTESGDLAPHLLAASPSEASIMQIQESSRGSSNHTEYAPASCGDLTNPYVASAATPLPALSDADSDSDSLNLRSVSKQLFNKLSDNLTIGVMSEFQKIGRPVLVAYCNQLGIQHRRLRMSALIDNLLAYATKNDLSLYDVMKNYFKNDREDDAAKLTSPTDAGTGRGRGKNNGDEVGVLKELVSL